METLDYRKAAWSSIYGAMFACITVGVPALLLSSVLVSGCIDMTIRFGNSGLCIWEAFLIFVISLGGLLSIATILLKRATRLDIVLSVAVTGIAVCLFLEYIVGIAGSGAWILVFTVLLGYMLSGRERWKITWKPKKQFLALILAIVLSISLYGLDPSPDIFQLHLFGHEHMLHIPLMLRFAGEVGVLIAAMHFGKGAKEWFCCKVG